MGEDQRKKKAQELSCLKSLFSDPTSTSVFWRNPTWPTGPAPVGSPPSYTNLHGCVWCQVWISALVLITHVGYAYESIRHAPVQSILDSNTNSYDGTRSRCLPQSFKIPLGLDHYWNYIPNQYIENLQSAPTFHQFNQSNYACTKSSPKCIHTVPLPLSMMVRLEDCWCIHESPHDDWGSNDDMSVTELFSASRQTVCCLIHGPSWLALTRVDPSTNEEWGSFLERDFTTSFFPKHPKLNWRRQGNTTHYDTQINKYYTWGRQEEIQAVEINTRTINSKRNAQFHTNLCTDYFMS